MAVANITSFIDHLSQQQKDALYQSPWTCQAVFRSLPPLAKAYVLDLLLIRQPVPQVVIDNRCSDRVQYGNQHKAALQRLITLNIYVEGKENNQPTYQLHPTFQERLQWALSTGGRLLSNVPTEVLSAAPALEKLDAWAHSQWEALQMYLLDVNTPGPVLPREVPLQPLDFHRLLVSAGLLVGQRHARSITDAGFQFLLRDSHRQLWVFLTRYIHDTAATSKGDLTALISFLMQLGFMRVGQPYALSDLNDMEKVVAGHMVQLGLLMPFEAGHAGYYCPTRLASSLCAAGGVGGTELVREAANADIAGGHIIVESNYKVNAWTTSRVQRSLLGLFCRCEASLPNFWVGSLTHDSVNSALSAGINAEEIIAYLQAHAHPQLANRFPVVPENVSDQIRLWEAESHRLKPEPAVFYDAFENLELYETVLAYAKAQGWLLWYSSEFKSFAAKESAHDKIRDAIKSVKNAQANGLPIPRLVQ